MRREESTTRLEPPYHPESPVREVVSPPCMLESAGAALGSDCTDDATVQHNPRNVAATRPTDLSYGLRAGGLAGGTYLAEMKANSPPTCHRELPTKETDARKCGRRLK